MNGVLPIIPYGILFQHLRCLCFCLSAEVTQLCSTSKDNWRTHQYCLHTAKRWNCRSRRNIVYH